MLLFYLPHLNCVLGGEMDVLEILLATKLWPYKHMVYAQTRICSESETHKIEKNLSIAHIFYKDVILLAEESMIQPQKWACDLVLTELVERSEKPVQINQLIMSNPSTYMIVPTIVFHLLSWQTSNQPYFILKVFESSGWELITLQLLKPCKMYANKWAPARLKIMSLMIYSTTNHIQTHRHREFSIKQIPRVIQPNQTSSLTITPQRGIQKPFIKLMWLETLKSNLLVMACV